MENMKVLCCDDDIDHLELISFMVRMERYDVISTTRPQDYLNDFFDFDVVITDYNMPICNGIEFARQIKEIKPDTLIILITNSNMLLHEYSFELSENIKIVFKNKDTKRELTNHLHNHFAKIVYEKNGSYQKASI